MRLDARPRRRWEHAIDIDPEDSLNTYRIRAIAPADDPQVAHIIRTVLGSFRCARGDQGPDPETDPSRIGALTQAYAAADREFYVVD